MKRTFFIIATILLPVILSSQNLTILKDTFPYYQGTIKFENRNSESIYSILKKSNELLINHEIKLDTPDKIMSVGKSNYNYSQVVSKRTVYVGGEISYVLTIDIKENVIRYTIDISEVKAGMVSVLGLLKEKPKDMVAAPILIEVQKFKDNLIKNLCDLSSSKNNDTW